MKKHSGMRPHDPVVLLKIAALGRKEWRLMDLSRELYISQSEITESLFRSMTARLISQDRKKLFKNSLLEFLVYGLKYVYPAKPGNLTRGLPTAHSAKPLSDIFKNSPEIFVWESSDGDLRGQSIVPLYPNAVKAAKEDRFLYEFLALTDAIRIGNTREYSAAVKELGKRMKGL